MTNAKEAEAAKERGNVAFKNKDYALALECFSEAVKHDAENIKYLSNRSACHLKLKDFKNSLKDAEKCIEMDPNWGKGYSRQGQALVAMGDYVKAIGAYALGIAKDPTNKLLTQGLASAQQAMAKEALPKKKKKKRKRKKKNGTKTQEKQQDSDPEDAVKDVDDVDELETKKGDGYVIGIDLGTTFSCVGVWKGDGVQIIETNDGHRTIPSYVAFMDDGSRATGYKAKNQATRNPVNTIYDVKRIIGQLMTDGGVEADCAKFPFKVINGPNDRPLIEIVDSKGRPKEQFAPEEISAMVLTTCKNIAEKFLGEKVSKAVITVPAYFNDSQRNATKAAGLISGLEVLRIINEPTAAALAYGLDNLTKDDSELKVLIFDLGGGTFDVSILSIEGGIFTVVATGGDTRLGGEDFDNQTIDYVIGEIKKHPKCPKQEPRENLRALQRIRKACEQAKRQLSNSKNAKITLDSLMTQKFDFSCQLTRAKFELLNRGSFTLCMDVVKRVIKDAKCKPGDIDEIVLVGGSTRIPKIQAMLTDFFDGKKLCKTLNPDEAVAYGAAIQGAILNGNEDAKTADLLLMDVTPLSLGVEVTGRVMSVIIPRNTPIPCAKTQVYTTEQNYQTKIDVAVYEGERLKTDDNNLLGEFTIDGLESAKRGEPQVDVTFSLDSNGILNVKAEDQKTGSAAHIEIQNKSRANSDDIERMIKEAERYRKQDLQRVQRIEAKNELETCIFQVLDVVSQIEDTERKLAGILRQAAEKEQAWLDDGNAESARVSEIRMRIRNLNKRVQNR